MKYKNIVTLLALAQINFTKALFGGESYAKFTEEELDKIDKALEKNATEDLKNEIETLKSEKAELEALNQELKENGNTIANAVEQALELNKIEPGANIEESIVALGTKCKEYGDSNHRNTLVPHNGKDKDPSENKNNLIDDVVDPTAPHNQID